MPMPMRRFTTTPIYLVVVYLIQRVCALSAQPYTWEHAIFHARGGAVEVPDVEFDLATQQDTSTFQTDDLGTSEKNAQLHFQGEFSHHQLFPFKVDELPPRQLYKFFQNRLHRNLLLKGGQNPTEDIPRTPELLEEWTQRSKAVSSTPPLSFENHHEDEQNHSVVAIHSTVPIVPGLSIKAVSYMGCRLLPNPRNFFPMYEFTLIQDRYQAHGSKPLVWLYRKVTGDSATTPTSSSAHQGPLTAAASTTGSRSTQGLCRVSFESHEEALRLSYYSMVKVYCNLPQRLLRVLPLSKQNIESKISASMAKQLQSEVLQSAEKFHLALKNWVAEQSYKNT